MAMASFCGILICAGLPSLLSLFIDMRNCVVVSRSVPGFLPNNGRGTTGRLRSYLHHGGGSGLEPLRATPYLGDFGKRLESIVGRRGCEVGEHHEVCVCVESWGSEARRQCTPTSFLRDG